MKSTNVYLTPATNGRRGELVEVESGETGAESYLTPDGKLINAATTAQNAAHEAEEYMPVRPYFAVNEMAPWDDLRQEVLRLMASVDRTSTGSVERLKAERDLIAAKSNLVTAMRARASELSASVAAMQPGTDVVERQQIETELAVLKELLEALEDDAAGSGTEA